MEGMRPTPTHLRKILVRQRTLPFPRGQSGIGGQVRCQCGSGTFLVHYAAERIESAPSPFLRTVKHEGRFFFIVKVQCVSCSADHVLLDTHRHGWDGLLCSSAEERDATPPSFRRWACHSCGGEAHAVEIELGGDDKREALLNAEGELTGANWFDAFGSMNIGVKCSGSCPPTIIAECETQ